MAPTRFLAVPTSALAVDPDISVDSPKGYSERELQEIAACIPAVYERIGSGYRDADFQKMSQSTNPRERFMAKTFSTLFVDSDSSTPFRASYDGTDLIVDSGNHRIRSARSIDVPVVPVLVSAPSEVDLDTVERLCSRRIEREGAEEYLTAHEALEAERSHERRVTREYGSNPGFEFGHRSPEFYR